jgi:hypothetical protein
MEETKKVGGLIWTIVALIVVAGGVYFLTMPNKSDDMTNVPVPGSDYYVSVVQVKHQFKNGQHTYVGSIDLPNACYRLDSDIQTIANTDSAKINLSTYTNNEEMCAQVVTSRSFRLTLDDTRKLVVTGMLNGKPMELNIFEVPADQDIDAFEINIKG